MIENAYLHEAAIKEQFYRVWYNPHFQYYFMGGYHSDWYLNHDNNGDWSRRVFAVLDPKLEEGHQLIGEIAYCIDHDTKSANSFGAINFTGKPSIVFAKALMEVVDDIFVKFGLNRMEFCCVIGNPAERGYDNFIKRVGGRIVGTRRQVTIDMASRLRDDKIYEVLRDDYMKYRSTRKQKEDT